MFWKTPKIPASYSIINHRGNWPGDTVISWSLSKHTTRSWICWVPLQFSGHLLKHTVGPKTESLVKLLSCPHSLIASLVFFLPSAVSSPSLSPTKSLARAQGLPPSSRRPSAARPPAVTGPCLPSIPPSPAPAGPPAVACPCPSCCCLPQWRPAWQGALPHEDSGSFTSALELDGGSHGRCSFLGA